jgi:hypothetical protein
MPGLMQTWFVPHGKPPKPKQYVTNNITSAGGGGGGASPSGVAPGTTPDDYTRNQTAYWQQLLAGTGNTQEGNQLPQGVQDNIDRQASLIGS